MMTPRQRLRIGAALLALDEVPFDVVLCGKIFNHIAEHLRHRHCLDEIGACRRKSFTFRGIRGDGRNCIRPAPLRGAQCYPDGWNSGRKIFAVLCGFRAVELNRRAAGIEERRLILLAQNRPRRHLRLIRQDGNPAPDKVGPR